MREKHVFLKVLLNRLLLVIFYILIIGGIGVGGYFIYISLYDFYFETDEIKIGVGDTKNSGLITKRAFEIQKGDYIYTIEDENVAMVDDDGNIVGLEEGETKLEVKYKYSLTSKVIDIIITSDSQDEDETGEEKTETEEEEEIIDWGLPK